MKRLVVVVATATVAVAVVSQVAAASDTDTRKPPARNGAVATSVIVPAGNDTPLTVYASATLQLARGVWHVTGAGDVDDCLPPTTTGAFIGDVTFDGFSAPLPDVLVDAGTTGATVTLQCHANFETTDKTEHLVAVPVTLQ